MRKILIIAAFLAALVSCGMATSTDKFVKVIDGQFIRNGKPYRYIGFNFWYAGILGSEGVNGDRERLLKELDFLQSVGVNNLRVMIGADGPVTPAKVRPSLQTQPGVYNDTLLTGLDYLLQELNKREMMVVLFFNNTWEWTGGYSQYLEWAGYGKAPVPVVDGWPVFQEYVGRYMSCVACDSLFKAHVTFIVNRVNSLTGVPYKEDPAIMSWQIANEPRPMGTQNKRLYEHFIASTAGLIKSFDKNHMVSVGSEGIYGSENDPDLYRIVHALDNIDYLTCHIWPKNWMWLNPSDIPGSLQQAIANTNDYIDTHLAVAGMLNKPLVISEFGLPRDNHKYSREDPVTCRNAYYSNIYERILESLRSGGNFAGCNMWAWGGFARPDNVFWQEGDEYCGDPIQEEQGLNSVFAEDDTVDLIKKYIQLINEL